MSFDPAIHHRHSIRLKSYDYAEAGAYFVTACVQDRRCLFGRVTSGEMQVNEPGRMVERWWQRLPTKFTGIESDVHVVMPNHFHGLVISRGGPVWPPTPRETSASRQPPGPGHPHGGAPTLGDVIDWFKTMTTNEYIRGVKQLGWPLFPGRLWQRNYYEHIVRDEPELAELREYIANNPLQWESDKLYPSLPPLQ